MPPADTVARSGEVAVESVADCPFSMAQEYADDYLRAAEHPGPEAAIGLPAVRHDVTLSFGVESDSADQGRSHDELGLRWESGTRFLPDFHGTVRFRIDGGHTRICVDGTYAPPFGTLGMIFDRIAGHLIARASLQDLANRLAAHLTRREAVWRLDHGELLGEGPLR